MHWFALLIAAAIALFVLDRLALWMHDRGWLDYRKRRRRPGDRIGDDAGNPPVPDKERDKA